MKQARKKRTKQESCTKKDSHKEREKKIIGLEGCKI